MLKALGYAETDPTADVEGWDVQSKIMILTRLAFGVIPQISDIYRAGICALTQRDFLYAKAMQLGCIKMIGRSVRRDNLNVEVSASPCVVPLASPLAAVHGAGNLVIVKSRNVPEIIYGGIGAGRYPTANAVIGDILRVLKHEKFINAMSSLFCATSSALSSNESYHQLRLKLKGAYDPFPRQKYFKGIQITADVLFVFCDINILS